MRRQHVQAIYLFAVVVVANHGVGLATARLSVGKTRNLGSLEGVVYERLYRSLVYLVRVSVYVEVVAGLVEYAVEGKGMLLDEFSQVHFLSGYRLST